MSDPRSFRWFTCECGERLTENHRKAHYAKEHVDRPNDDALTTDEVAAILGCTRQAVHQRIDSGKLTAFEVMQGRRMRKWVMKASLRHYIRMTARQPEAVVRWANKGELLG